MNVYAANVLLRNLIGRIEIQDDGSGTLTGRLTADELARKSHQGGRKRLLPVA